MHEASFAHDPPGRGVVRDVVVASPARLAEALAEGCARQAAAAIAARGGMAIAVPGGSVATALFPRLARLPLDWSRVAFFWTDERAVPPDDEASNFRLARELWLEPAGVPAASVHRMPAELADLDAAATAYARELTGPLGDPPRLDLVLLGVGEDGHVASLFPGHPLLGEERALVAAVADAPKPPPRRLTLTLPALVGARLVVVAAFGAGKAGVMREALGDPTSDLPVALVLRCAAASLVLLDPPAAGRVGSAHRPSRR